MQTKIAVLIIHTNTGYLQLQWVCTGNTWPYIWRLETRNRGHIGGSCGWSSTLEHRPWVRAPGRGSFLQSSLSSCVVSKPYANLHIICGNCWLGQGYVKVKWQLRGSTGFWSQSLRVRSAQVLCGLNPVQRWLGWHLTFIDPKQFW